MKLQTQNGDSHYNQILYFNYLQIMCYPAWSFSDWWWMKATPDIQNLFSLIMELRFYKL